jgi:tetratricopeptide (TPR) repeat protein
MIRRDYLFRAIEQCVRALARIQTFTREKDLVQARAELNHALESLAGLDLQRALAMSDAELIVELLKGEPTQVLRDKGLLLVAFFERAGEIYAAESRPLESGTCFLRALTLQLQILSRDGAMDLPEYVPRVEGLLGRLQEQGTPLPIEAALGLMQHYERTGQFAKAEDVFFTALEQQEDQAAWAKFGLTFYERLLRQPDLALEMGNLPRAEVEAGMTEIKSRL